MTNHSDAFNGVCPDCGHVFTLADLKRMAAGDGWQRYLVVRLKSGARAVVTFDDFDALTMQLWKPAAEGGTSDPIRS